MRTYPILTLAFLLLIGLGCSSAHVAGTYEFQAAGLKEIIELKEGGEFTQTIISWEKTFNGTGKWTLNGSGIKFRGDFWVRFDSEHQRNLIFPQKYSLYSGYWDVGRKRISFDLDNEEKYFITQKSDHL